MNIVHFGEGECGKIRRYLDSYIDNELLVETNHEVLRHLEKCPSCAAELEARTRLRARVKAAVQSQAVPPDLRVRVHDRIGVRSRRPAVIFGWIAAVAMAVVLFSLGSWDLVRDRQDAYILRISRTISAQLSPGLKDHVHCAIFRKYPRNPPTLEQMAKDMGPANGGLVQLVKQNVPERYRMVMAHQCSYKGRKYTHLTLRDGAHLISVVIARKETGETLAKLQPAVQPSGIPVYQSTAERFQVAGFETAQYLAFVVSDIGADRNMEIAGRLAPVVYKFLAEWA
jgi:anti-sigma factor (TIGR02949 family)